MARRTGHPRDQSHLGENPLSTQFLDAARLVVFFKANESHDYKFSSAVFEDHRNDSPAWRDRYLAAAAYWRRGSNDREAASLKRTREALKA